jgi:hypothetical protein
MTIFAQQSHFVTVNNVESVKNLTNTYHVRTIFKVKHSIGAKMDKIGYWALGFTVATIVAALWEVWVLWKKKNNKK